MREKAMDELWSKIEKFEGSFSAAMEAVEKELGLSIPETSPDCLYAASRHLISTGGKRIRPALVALSSEAAGGIGSSKSAASIATAIELIHTATIIHDDIIDRSTMRRGVETVNAKWGDDTALIAGDLIFSKAFGLVGMQENRRISSIISNACVKLAEGEVLEMLHTGDINMTEEVYLEIIERKTASLFEACTACGGILGGGSEEKIEALSRYGRLLGIGFQITDDLLDVVGEVKLGKPVGSDVRLGKPTLPVLHALRVVKGRNREILGGVILGKKSKLGDVKTALKIIKGANSVRYAAQRAKFFIERAKSELRALPESGAKKSLGLIADYAISREF